ncbi:MAG: preprotein translocase subunit YajC [Hydrogenobaculum sp.]|jgi:preprotein translocase, YajC subunit|uniref:preprotein translocase subunit YajC n=1 Tax=unclassified Hydrogenobaculum TaxID=2622382 RepID=UPI0001C50355|nr:MULTISPECIES: preprotein translocase subunit YajC [unclassified Hydrogenobaculum]AEF19189.1 preprotein translocase, YajC subunit [Hydrogenobaculum sp. 3684]AEG46478.1 preprotein translocase, YajC subunit [Hydrogenobaculum sp. SHO]AGG15122.1 preprotein translocase, YajC subunit [Hydrogenobaculum sp. HO]AGH93418.1 preprotein translocase, YajC subunit [Hydrogenobaculum sp. SN]
MNGNPMGPILAQLVFIGIIFVIFYFLIIKPQQTQRKKHQEFLSNLKKGDKVITSSGIWGVISDITDDTITLKVDTNTKIKFTKETIIAYQPSKEESKEKEDEK